MTSHDERFPPAERLRKRSEFLRVSRSGTRSSGPRLLVYAAKNTLDWSRVGLTVSRKVGNATRRNRWKRRLREIFRRNKDHVPSGWDYVVIVKRSSGVEPDLDVLRDELLTLMSQARHQSPR